MEHEANQNHTDVFNKACLVKFTTSSWPGSATLPPAVMAQLGDTDWLKGRKRLVDEEFLKPVTAVVARVRKFLARNSLPFPINGLALIANERIPMVDEGLKMIQKDFNEAIDKVCHAYADQRELAREKLGTNFDPAEYPVNLRNKFSFDWQYVMISKPGRNSLISREMYEREIEKFTNLMDETREMGVLALREELKGLVDHMIDRLKPDAATGKPKKFKDSIVKNFEDFFERFKDRDIFGDRELTQIVAQARDVMSAVTPDDLRKLTDVREGVTRSMTELKAAVDASIENLPRRRIKMEAA